MNIREKLQQLERTNVFRPVPARITSGRQNLEQIAAFLNARILQNSFGTSLWVKQEFDLATQHGNTSLGQCLDFDSSLFAYIGKSQELGGLNLAKTLFVDTETTGLAGGTGTYVFLAGCGYFTRSSFVIEQYFMPDYGAEKSLLWEIYNKFSTFDAFISYNGRAYDFSLLRSRFILARMQSNLEKPHLDLLYAVRRLWKKIITDCRLGAVEQNVLGVHRIDDVQGQQIPSIYFDFLQTGRLQELQKVFFHNRLDLLSLVSILTHGLQIFQPGAHHQVEFDPDGVLTTFESLKQWQLAAHAAEQYSHHDRSLQLQSRLAGYYKKMSDWQKATTTWQAIINSTDFDPQSYIELAKYFEHHTRDYERALHLVNRALHTIETIAELRDTNAYGAEKLELLVRRNRLTEKLKTVNRSQA